MSGDGERPEERNDHKGQEVVESEHDNQEVMEQDWSGDEAQHQSDVENQRQLVNEGRSGFSGC